MATGALKLRAFIYGYICIFLLKSDTFSCEQFSVSFTQPSDCGVENYFDISSLSCVKCGPNQMSSKSGFSCECQTGFKVLASTGASITCQKCSDSAPGVTQDGYGCVRCPGSPAEDGKCQCPTGSILVERNLNGTLLTVAACEACSGTEPAFSVPDPKGNRCVRCQDSFINTSQSCTCGSSNTLAGGMCFPPSNLPPPSNVPSVYFAQLGLAVPSAWLSSFLYSSAAACLLFSNRTACQALGNMCVLNMHSLSTLSNDACGLYSTIYRTTAAQGNNQGIPYWRVSLPWLYYGEQAGLASRVLQTDPLPVGFSFKGVDRNTNVELLAAVYSVRGEFMRWENVSRGTLQLCPDTTTRLQAAFMFGTAYKQKCVLSVSDLLASQSEPLFYDVFLVQQKAPGDRRLIAVPTLNLNLQFNGQSVNQASNMNGWYLTRRLVLVDTLSGREKSLSSTPRAIRVASDLKIRFQLVPSTQKGEVYPPLTTVSYSDILISDPVKQTVTVSFSVEYEMDQNEARVKTDIALGVLGGVAVVYSLLKTASWKRRIASPLIDLQTILKFLLFYAGDLANVFFVVTVGTGLYWLIFYKAQQFVSVFLPLPAQEERFVIYVGCAFALKMVQFLHKLLVQLSVDIFFIDWERPRGKASKPVNGPGEVKTPASPVSIWRTYFVANEWNEIQTIRKISPTFQVVSVLFFLEVAGFSSLALRDPSSELQRSAEAYTPAYSRVLRYGVATAIWLCLGFIQMTFFSVVYERFVEDKIRQFVDLCSLSNISVLLLSQRCFGYYIHGRSVHGHADTNMEEMNSNMKREMENLCGQRGLLPNSDVQTFQVSVTSRLRAQYDRILEPLSRRNGPSRLVDASANPYEQSTKAYHTMNRFLGSIIDHAHREMDYIVKDKLLFERIIGMEFIEPLEKSIFYNDDSYSFVDVLYYGNEATLLIFDMLFFCVVDLGSQNFVLASVLTYLQQLIFRLVRNGLGRRNLATKTLVDKRFLI
ncbi:meckelin isoform X2 [Electrophorus electricus]|uniref:meckelin isoform X2 n=1 Tax=Electrophorus electricus TaxID=8005 RepID=UPI0015D029B6|nr:meckelin isoform X2 [Electrophorus electricus]